MTASAPQSGFPDSVNPEELQKLMDAAAAESAPEKTGPYDGLTKDEICALVKDTLDAFDEKCGHPIGQKLIALTVLSNMITWHSNVGVERFDDSQTDSAVGWLRDAGKFQAAMAILCGIAVSNDDWTCGE